MDNVVIKFVKTHEDAKLPTKAHQGDNCFDLYAVEDTVIPRGTLWSGR
jgi:dUTPase